MTYIYKTRGTCSSQITVTIENGIVTALDIKGGCDGNTTGISRLVIGMPADEVVRRCKGIPCGMKTTSCPDQLACAISEALAQAEEQQIS